MEELIFVLGKQLALVGPVGIFTLAGYWMWLRFGRGNRDDPPRSTEHMESHDRSMDVHGTVKRIETLQADELRLLREIADLQNRTASALERMEYRLSVKEG